MDLRRTFNEDAKNYDTYRPLYADELYKDILEYSGIGKESNVLEIGIGTGQATLPFLQTGCSLTAVELGDNLAAYSMNKFSAYQNMKIIQADFTEYEWKKDCYDLVYSATAFHWIPEERGCSMVRDILKPGGKVALFWNHPYPNRTDDETNVANRRIYNKYRHSDKPVVEFSEKDSQEKLNMLEHYGFSEITSKLYYRTRTLKTGEYISLLNTYSDHRALPPDVKTAFDQDMKKAIDAVGGKIRIYDTMDLYLARK